MPRGNERGASRKDRSARKRALVVGGRLIIGRAGQKHGNGLERGGEENVHCRQKADQERGSQGLLVAGRAKTHANSEVEWAGVQIAEIHEVDASNALAAIEALKRGEGTLVDVSVAHGIHQWTPEEAIEQLEAEAEAAIDAEEYLRRPRRGCMRSTRCIGCQANGSQVRGPRSLSLWRKLSTVADRSAR